MNEKTAQWLRSIKIPPGHINEVQLKNGYLFGLIFQKLNLAKDKKFKNTHDLACIFQNFKNAKDLLYDHFSVMFPANQIIYRSSQLLQKIRQVIEQHEQNKKQLKLGQIKKKYMTMAQTSQHNATGVAQQRLMATRQKQVKQSSVNNTMSYGSRPFSSNQPKLPPKILQIEKKLSKYKQQKSRHELLNLEARKQQQQSANQTIQDHRYFQISKLKMNQQMRRQFQKRVADVVAKTSQKKQQRVQKEQQFLRFTRNKKENIYNEYRTEEQRTFNQGLQDFQLNCLKQGVQLQHDPNKPYIQKQDNSNSKVMLERIKDNIRNLQRQRKQREKRVNSKSVQTQETNAKSQKIWQQNYLVQRLQKSLENHKTYLQQNLQRIRFQIATKAQIQLKLSNKTLKPLLQATQQQKQEFQAGLRANRLIYYDKQIQRLQAKDKFLREIASQALQALLYTTITAQQQQKNLNFTYSQWKQLQGTFISYDSLPAQKRRKQAFETVKKQPQQHQVFDSYINQLKRIQSQKINHMGCQQKQLAEFTDSLVESAYPKKKLPEPANLPLYMPLRIGITGSRLSGKTTQIKKLISKYNNLILIDPKKILTQALELARPPIQNEDPKKKKDPKKVEEQSPQKVDLKRFGEQIYNHMKSQAGGESQPSLQYECLDFEYVLKAIKFKLLQCFTRLSPEQVLQRYIKSEQQQVQRIKDFQKNQQQKSKKKDSKKGAVIESAMQSPILNQFPYTEGFLIENVQLNQENLRQMQKQLNGFIKGQQRLNQQAQQLRQQLGKIVPIHKSQISQKLDRGFFNVVVNLDVSPVTQQERNEGRRVDPQTGQVYHPKFNPVPTDVKGLAERLIEVKKANLQRPDQSSLNKAKKQNYYSSFGYQNYKQSSFHSLNQLSAIETNTELVKIIQNCLKVEYETIKSYHPQVSHESKQVDQSGEILQKEQKHLQLEGRTQQSVSQGKLLNFSGQVCVDLLGNLLEFNSSYQMSLNEQLSSFASTRFSFEQSLLSQQRTFLQIITRPDDKANRILTFQDNYNKLLDQKANIINDKSAINHLVSKLDQLYDSLWINIQAKKNQAIQKRKQIISNSWLNQQLQSIVEIGKSILQSELNYLVDMLSFILIAQLKLQGKETEPVIDYLCLGIPKQKQPIQSVISSTYQEKVSPRLQFYINQVQSCLSSLSEWYSKKQSQSKIKLSSQLEQLSHRYIAKQKQRINVIIEYLAHSLFSFIQEQTCYFKALVNKMDDWIIFGIKQQNEFTYSIYKQLKTSIQKVSKSHLKELFATPITAIIKPIQRMTIFPLPLPLKNTKAQTFDYSSYKIFLQEIKCLYSSTSLSQSTQVLKIDFSRFKEYFNKRKKSKLLNQIYLRLDFDIMQQYLVTDNEANFRQIALAMLLWNFNVLDEQKLNNYAIKLSNSQSTQQKITLSRPQQLSLQTILPSLDLSYQQHLCIQNLIFDIMQNQYTNQMSIKEYMQILGSFNSLQLFKYGDSLMPLNGQR